MGEALYTLSQLQSHHSTAVLALQPSTSMQTAHPTRLDRVTAGFRFRV